MSILKPHVVHDEDDNRLLAYVHPASKKLVDKVLNASVDGLNGRTNWVWVRLANGDLVLGVFPQGDTYLECEKDAQYPH